MSAFDDFCNRQSSKQASDAIGPNVPGGVFKNLTGISVKSSEGFVKGTEGLHGSYMGGLGSVAWGSGKPSAVFKAMAEAHADIKQAAANVKITPPESGGRSVS